MKTSVEREVVIGIVEVVGYGSLCEGIEKTGRAFRTENKTDSKVGGVAVQEEVTGKPGGCRSMCGAWHLDTQTEHM